MEVYLNPNLICSAVKDNVHDYKMMKEIFMVKEARDAVKMINTIAYAYGMYPLDPIKCFSGILSMDSSIIDTSGLLGIIVGGVPSKEHIKEWTGIGYSYKKGTSFTPELHRAIAEDRNSEWTLNYLKGIDCERMRNENIAVIHEVLSVPDTDNATILKANSAAWETIIWLMLNYLSGEDSAIPVLFTTSSASTKFDTAVRSSFDVVNGYFESSGEWVSSVGGLRQKAGTTSHFQTLMNLGVPKSRQIDLIDFI